MPLLKHQVLWKLQQVQYLLRYEDYIDIVSLRIKNDQMQMYVVKNGKYYTYIRLKVPLQSSSEW